jgi:hypothetical protein
MLLLDRAVAVYMLLHRCINFVFCRAGANMEDKVTAEVMVVEVRVQDKEEGDILSAFPVVPCGHDERSVPTAFRFIEMRLDECLVNGVVPLLAVLASANCVPIRPKEYAWSRRELARLGKASDRAVARELGISVNAVATKREALGIPTYQ